MRSRPLLTKAGNGKARMERSEIRGQTAEVTYEELAVRMKKHGFKEKASIASRLSRNTAPAVFIVAALVAIRCGAVKLGDI
jgi:Domain of unknown function (DUF6471)